MQPVKIFEFVSSTFYSLEAAYVFQWEEDIFRGSTDQMTFLRQGLQAEQELKWNCWQPDLSIRDRFQMLSSALKYCLVT